LLCPPLKSPKRRMLSGRGGGESVKKLFISRKKNGHDPKSD